MFGIIIGGILILILVVVLPNVIGGAVVGGLNSYMEEKEKDRVSSEYNDKFNPQEIVYNNLVICMEVDTSNKRWRVNKGTIYDYKDLRDFELLEKSNGSYAKASAAPSFLGAMLDVPTATNTYVETKAYSSMMIRISFKDLSIQDQYIRFASNEKGSLSHNKTFETVQKCMSLLRKIKAYNEENIISNKKTESGSSTADELIKLKSLLDAGVITQEEFETQKQKLL